MPNASRRISKLLSRATALFTAVALAAGLAAPALAQQGRAISMIRDTEIEEILRDQATPVFEAAGLNPRDVDILLVNDKELNAFVSGGQNIFLNTGLILKTEGPDQLLGVIAHETGHIALAHLARAPEGARGAIATQLITLGLGMVAAITAPDPRAAVGILSSANMFATLQFFTYTRVQEATADQAAAEYLQKAGVSGKGLVQFLGNFRSQEVFDEAARMPYFRSHPLSSVRIGNLQTRVTGASNYDKPESEEALARHAIMIAKLRGFLNYPIQTYQQYPETDTSFPARYARAIAYYKDLDLPRALQAMDEMIADHPENPYLHEFKGQMLFESGRIDESQAPLARAVELKPDAPLLRVLYAQALVASTSREKAQEAISHLQRALVQERDNPLGWRVLADAYQETEQPGLARLATAEQNFHMGQMAYARDFGVRALELLERGTPEYRRATDIVSASENIVMNRRRGG